ANPVARLAIAPAHRIGGRFVHDLEAEEGEKTTVKNFRFFEVADPNGDVIDADEPSHLVIPSRKYTTRQAQRLCRGKVPAKATFRAAAWFTSRARSIGSLFGLLDKLVQILAA